MKRLCLVALGFVVIAVACAPEFQVAVFSYRRHPDLPRGGFINGQLDVLRPTYARSYLILAYRHLSGVGLNTGEREQARDYYKDRNTGWWDRTGTDWNDRWNALRAGVPGAAPRTANPLTRGQMAYQPDSHSFVLNCADDAYRIAHHTLEARIGRFGLRSAAVREWTIGQDSVFANCDGGPAVIPRPAPAGLPDLIRDDRAYQIAAAHFYSGAYEQARDEFATIGREPRSPWRTISRYLVARTLLRMDSYDALEREAKAILSDGSLRPIHGMTGNLLHRVEVYRSDEAYFRDLARQLAARGQDNGLREELWNYTTLYDHFIGEADPNAVFAPQTKVAANLAFFEKDDLSSWIFHFQSRDASSVVRSRLRWQQTRALPWLVAALAHANASDAAQYGLLDAARKVPHESPARLTVAYHYHRLLLEGGNREEVRSGVDTLLSAGGLTPSSANLFRGLRMMASPRFDEFLGFAVRRPVLLTHTFNIGQTPAWEEPRKLAPEVMRFDRDSAYVFNRLTPLRLWREAAISGALPAHLSRELTLAAFTRGLMLDEDVTVLARRLGEISPELAVRTGAYGRQTSAEDRRFAGVFLLLHRPEARPFVASGIDRQTRPGKIDSYRDNWWCPLDLAIDLDSRPNIRQLNRWDGGGDPETPEEHPAFLSEADIEQARREWNVIAKLGNGTEYMGRTVIGYARRHTADPRVPEALHLVVRSARYGCADTGTWKTTRDAFRLLHSAYPRNPWTAKTPSWHSEGYTIRDQVKDMR